MKHLLSCTLFLLTMNCNNLFYYPDKINYSSPSDLNINYDTFTIKTADNEELHVWKLYGKQEQGIIIQFHGNAQNLTSHYLSVAWLTAHGFSVYTFDYRGYGKSSGKPTREGLVQDGQAIIKYVCRETKKPVFIIGQSLGGAVAVPAIALTPNNCIKSLILESTFSSYRHILSEKLKSNAITYILARPLSYLVSDDYSPLSYINELSIPIIMFHSLKDPIVPFKEGSYLFENIRQKNKQFITIKKEGHVNTFDDPNDPYRQIALNFLKNNTFRN